MGPRSTAIRRFYSRRDGGGLSLETKGVAVGICTNKPEGLAQTLLMRLGIRGEFAALVGADTLPVRKPDPAPLFEARGARRGARDRSILIGDT